MRKKRNWRESQRGIITVMVTLLMVPVVTIAGLMVDVSRLKLYSSQSVMAADAYAEAILSEYENLLKELYGLFAVSQNEDGLAAIEKFKEYAKYSFNPSGDGKIGASGVFMPYKDLEVDFSYEMAENASLSNNSVLETQIADFMKYRVVEEVLEKGNVLNLLDQFNKMDADMQAMKDRNEVTKSCQKTLNEIDDYYKNLKQLSEYPRYIRDMQGNFMAYSNELEAIRTGPDPVKQEYSKYVYYKTKKSDYEKALKKAEDKRTDEEKDLIDTIDHMKEEVPRLEEYDKVIKEKVDTIRSRAKNFKDSQTTIEFRTVEARIQDLYKHARNIDKNIQQLVNKVNELKGELSGCTQDAREGIEKEIKDLEELLDWADDFMNVYNAIDTNMDVWKNNSNKEKLENQLKELDNAYENLKDGNLDPTGGATFPRSYNYDWYDFQENSRYAEFFKYLKNLCEGDGSDGDKKAGDKKTKAADDKRKKAEDELKKEETTNARDISGDLASQLQSSGANTSTPDFMDYMSGGLSFKSLGGMGTQLLDKFLVMTYDFNMFSSRVTGIKPPDEKNEAGDADGGGADAGSSEGASEGEYADYSLTGYKMSKNINYLYGAELEYLIGGNNSSKKNLELTRNIICGVRMTLNFVATYTIDEVNNIIDKIAQAAADAVAASAVGAPAAPLVYVAVSGALRAAFATMETVGDWNALKERKAVKLTKGELDDLQAYDLINDLLEGKLGEKKKGEGGSEIELTYEDYLYILLFFMADNNTLMNRNSNLITLNVNQAQNEGDTLSSLKFKMSDTITAVKATCKVKGDFVVVPDNFMSMFLGGTTAESTVEQIEGTYFGYSIIRGY